MALDTGLTADLLPPLNALANSHRLDLLHLLRDPGTHFPAQPAGPADEIGVCVTDLQAKLKLSQSTTSQYLALLERSGMVAAQRIGQWTYWKLKEDRVRAWLARLEHALTHPRQVPASPAEPAVKLQDILAARLRIQPHVRCTPLEPSPGLSRLTGAEVRIKFEHLQHTGGSAARAGVNWLRLMREEKPGAGVVMTAAAPREIGLAYAGRRLSVPACAFLAEGVGPQATEQFTVYGTEVRRQPDSRAAEQAALALAGERGWLLPPAGTHPAVLSGVGTIVVELFEEYAGLDAVVVPADGVTLFPALNYALRTVDPGIRVFAVRSRPGEQPPASIPALSPGARSDRTVTVSAEELRSAAAWMLAEHGMALPPAGTAAIGYLLSAPDELRGRHVAAIVPGSEY